MGVADGSTLLKAEETCNTEQRADPARDKPARRVAAARRKKTRNEALRLSGKPRRSDSKQALVLAMLHRRQGATIAAITKALPEANS